LKKIPDGIIPLPLLFPKYGQNQYIKFGNLPEDVKKIVAPDTI
jgi:hypothetical protein